MMMRKIRTKRSEPVRTSVRLFPSLPESTLLCIILHRKSLASSRIHSWDFLRLYSTGSGACRDQRTPSQGAVNQSTSGALCRIIPKRLLV
ncbi:hypothetical protein RSOLAG1IB_09582 [Rhizoctonia solani AG-1 IB]|uniref:Uncharacterized protein n=1 Tax=Thanatephorus cucumeris (strain AG1-IB / isolate 7/3/14) TaxID=1108050 RepID=A0A0B7FU12_THACB|nr:hypothetical protein RSOLAG1IB_09582 [Rhizoctonia solani AG-1 IB]